MAQGLYPPMSLLCLLSLVVMRRDPTGVVAGVSKATSVVLEVPARRALSSWFGFQLLIHHQACCLLLLCSTAVLPCVFDAAT